MKTRSLLLRAVAFAPILSPLRAAPDSVDTAFAATAGQVFLAPDFGGVSSVLVQPDGKILFGSNEMPGVAGGTPLALPLIRFNPDGSVDNTFFADNHPTGSDSGIYYDSAGWPEVHALGLLSDGKIVAAGVMQGVRTGTVSSPGIFLRSNSIVRFNPDGTIDPTFQTAGTTQWPTGGLNYIEEVAIQPDDKIIVAGGFGGFRDSSALPAVTRYGLARLNVDGSLDTGFDLDPAEFGVPAGASQIRGFFRHAAVEASGKILVVGSFEWGSSFPAPTVHVCARLFPNGARDFSFQPVLPTNLDRLEGIVIEPDGNVMVLGQFTTPTNTSWMVRLQPDGSPAAGFTLDPAVGVVTARPLQRDPGGKYLVTAGGGGSSQSQLIRLLPDGSRDPSFSASALWTNHPNGTPESGYFGNFTTAPSGKIYSGSAFDSVNGVSTVKVVSFDGDTLPAGLSWAVVSARVTENAGALTLSVLRTGPLTGAASVNVSTIAGTAGPADFTAVAGTLTWPDGTGGAQMVTIPITQDALTEGAEAFTVELSGAGGASVSGPATATVTIEDDEALPVIVVPPAPLVVKEGQPANFSVVVSATVPATYQWRKNGTDIPNATSAFYHIPAAGPGDEAAYSVVVSTPAGAVPSGGAMLTVVPPSAVLDATFVPPASGLAANGAWVLAGGAILVQNGSGSLVRLDTSGAVDPSFAPTFTLIPGMGSLSLGVVPLPDGRFLVRGAFNEVNGLARNQVVRFNADFTLDTTFQVPVPASPLINGLIATAGGTVYLQHKPQSVAGGIYRLLENGSYDPGFVTALGTNVNGSLRALLEMPDGSLLVSHTTGSSFNLTRGISRLLPDGSPYPGFQASTSLFPEARDFVLLPDGRFAAARGSLLEIYDALGVLQQTFTFTGTVNAVRFHRGRFLVAGVTGYGGTTLRGLARLLPDGTLDENFPGGAGPNANVSGFVIDGEDRLLVTGTFSAWNGLSRNRVARLLVPAPELAFQGQGSVVVENQGTFTVGVVRYGDPAAAVSVRVTSVADTAVSPGDFAAVDETLGWAAGDAAPKQVTVSLADDATLDGDLGFSLTLSDATGAAVLPGTHRVLIRDDESMPRILTAPVPSFGVVGKPVSFSVTAESATGLTYQWFLDGQPIAGATGSTYQIASVSAANEGDYTVRVTNAYESLLSPAASLMIIGDPASLASGFVPPTPLTGPVVALAPAPDGGVYVGGQFVNVGGDAERDYLVKLNADGSLDSSFTPPLLGGNTVGVRDLALQPDGKLIVVGHFTNVAGSSLRRIVRLLPSGEIDPDFSAAVGIGPNGDLNAVDLVPDGSILLGGSFSSWNNVNLSGRDGLIRLHPDGTVAGNVYTDLGTQIADLMLLPDGDLLVAYNTTSSSAAKVRRFRPDLTLNPSFTYGSGRTKVERMALSQAGNFLFAGSGGLFEVDAAGAILVTFPNTGFLTVARQLNGKVLAGGTSASRLFRYLPGGTADPIFSVGTLSSGGVSALALRGNGNVWAGGSFTNINGTTVNYVALLNGDPIPLAITAEPAAMTVVDPSEDISLSVGATGMTALSYRWHLDGEPLEDGPGISGSGSSTLELAAVDAADSGDYTVVVSNEAGSVTSRIAKLIVLGAPQIVSISPAVTLVEGRPLTLTVQAIGAGTLEYQWFRGTTELSGKTGVTLTIPSATVEDSGDYTVLVTNDLGDETSDAVAVTVEPNGAVIAPGFTPPSLNGIVRSILPLEGGRVLVGGDFTSASDGTTTSGTRLAVIGPDGAVVPVPGLSADGSVYAIRRISDGNILLAGAFNQINGQPRRRSARLLPDLSLDASFDPGDPGVFGAAIDIAEESSGTILLAGDFADYGGDPAADYIVRLSASGERLPTFTSGANSFVKRVLPQPDGSAFLIGWFGPWAGSGGNNVAHVLPDGSPSGTVHPVSFLFGGDGIDLGGGRFIAAGGFSGTTFLLKPDGTADSSFLSSGAANSVISALALDPAGRLILGGNFTSITGVERNRIVRLTTEGLRDDTFDVGSGFDGAVEDIQIAPDGSYWLGGNFTSYNGRSLQRLVRLKGEPAATGDPYGDFVAGLPENQRGEGEDPDGDGFPNLVEFLFGTDPSSGVAAPAPLSAGSVVSGASLIADHDLSLDPAKSYRVIAVEFPADLAGMEVRLEASADLTFSDGAMATEVGLPEVNGAVQIRRYVIRPAVQDAPTLFWRLSVTR